MMPRSGPVPTVSSVSSTGRNPGIDLLRGISILLVLTHHLALRIPLARTGLAAVLPHRLLSALSWSGGNAVTMFFTISGFLIAGHVIERRGSLGRIDAPAFYRRRLRRIAPLLAVLLAVLAALHLLHVPNYTILRPTQSLAGALISALTMWLNVYEGRTGYLPGGWDVLWSLSIEEAFYLGFPLVCLLLGRHDRLAAVLFAALALSLPYALHTLSGAPDIWQEKATWPGMCAIATGITAALIAARLPPPGPSARRVLGGLAALCVAGFLLEEPALFHAFGNPVELALPLGTAALLLAFHHGWAPNLAHRGFGWLRAPGRLSYEIYLTHMFVIFPVVWAFHRTGGWLGAGFCWFPPALLLACGLGAVVAQAFTPRACS